MRALILTLAILFSSLAWAKEPGILPARFRGWKLSRATVKTSSDPAAADAADAAVLKEYGFAGVETGTYAQNGRTMQIQAARFDDTSGAFGAFTFYRQPQMQAEKIGDRAASNTSRVLFYRGNVLVDATLEHVTAMPVVDLRALAAALPQPKGQASACPPCESRLPQQSLLANTRRYIVGPMASGRLGLPIPASLIDFSKGAEIETGTYRGSTGEASLTVIEYPTPQIAASRLRAMQAALLPGGPFSFKRSGPLVVAVNGTIPAAEAKRLLDEISYNADVTELQPARSSHNENPAGFIVALILLVVLVLAAALVFSLGFAGLRLLTKKFFPNRFFDRDAANEIIRLNLK